MPDRLFADPDLAAIYDEIDSDRSDLDHYQAIIAELGPSTVLDVGCGTGTLACRLANKGLVVTGVDPATASLAVARAKPGSETITWIDGTVSGLPPIQVDLATMTGNVAQVFVTDEDWRSNLLGIHRAVRGGGHLVFETRDPAFRAWEEWNDQPSSVRQTSSGPVDHSIELTAVELPLVSFRLTYRFHTTGATLTSDSTLRFRSRSEIEADLSATGFDVVDVRDAPDRPGREFVFIANATQRS